MLNQSEIIKKDLNHIWHPCMQMKDFEQSPPLIVNKARGSYLYTNEGKIIDGISSWWCKSLGHNHPAIVEAISKQLTQFEHIIAATTTHPLLTELGERLAAISKKQHVFFASDGSSAVEIALKLTMHANQIKGQSHRKKFISLANSYHGETLATLSISDLGMYNKPYNHLGLDCYFIDNIPYVNTINSDLWNSLEQHWEPIKAKLDNIKNECCALIVEPIIQGAAGMHCYSADFLKKLAHWAKTNDIYFICDEIMTGIGRTGKWLAAEHAEVEADLICLSKGLTGGSLPLSCVLIDHSIYELFYDDYEKGNSFLHSHTYSANALAVSAAVATLKTIDSEGILQQATELGQVMHGCFQKIAEQTGKLTNVRSIGAMVAGDFINDDNHQRLGFKFAREALKRKALLRPIGNTLYWLPPLNTQHTTITNLAEITLNSIESIYNNWV